MARYQVRDAATGIKQNVIEWDGERPLDLPGKLIEPDDGSPIGPPPSTDDLLAYAADARWRIEQGGITLPNTVRVATDDAAQRKISELRRRVEAGEISVPFGFKAASGWVDLDTAAIVAVDQAVAAHVQACYATERQVGEDIAAGTITTTAEIDAAFAALA